MNDPDIPESQDNRSTKACPFCGETILSVAVKCKHCGEFLKEDAVLSGPSFRAKLKWILSSLFILVIIICIYVFSGIGAYVDAQCQVNGFGIGSCEFVNYGWSPGSMCSKVVINNKRNEVASSNKICSGLVWPGGSSTRSVGVEMPREHCRTDNIGERWSDVCVMGVIEAE